MVHPSGSWLWMLTLNTVAIHSGQLQLFARSIALVYRGEVIDNPAYFNSTLRTYPVNPSQSGFRHDYDTELLLPIERMTFHAQFLLRMNGRYQASMYNRTLDACAFLRRPKEPLIKMLYDDLQLIGRLPTRCPIAPGWYHFRNCTFGRVQLPPFLPEGYYQFNVRILIEQMTILEQRWFGKLKKI